MAFPIELSSLSITIPYGGSLYERFIILFESWERHVMA